MNHTTSRPLITTIIPTFRRPKLLQRAIRSVLNQTYPHFQVCVYDNASGDETAEVMNEFAQKDHRVKYRCHPENIGVAKNFIYGMERVETPFFSFLSDDDLLLPDFYTTTINVLSQYPEAMFCATETISMDFSGKVLCLRLSRLKWQEGLYKPYSGLLAMIRHRPPTWTGILFRSEVIRRIGGLDIGIGAISDFEFTLRIATHFPYYVSLEPGAIFIAYLTHGCNSGGFDPSWQEGWDKMIKKNIGPGTIPSSVREEVRRLLVEWNKSRIKGLWKNSIIRGDYDAAIKFADLFSEHFPTKSESVGMKWIASACKNSSICRIMLQALKFSHDKVNFIRRRNDKKIAMERNYSKYLEF